MTALAFILGCLPLWFGKGAGGASRQILGTVVVGGMMAATAIAIFLVPVTFSMAERSSQRFGKVHDGSIDAAHPAVDEALSAAEESKEESKAA
jgi:HAE1 family hydrophobic/amphiphilic exporter-1